MMNERRPLVRLSRGPSFRRGLLYLCIAALVVLAIGTLRDPGFWWSADQRGDALFRARQFGAAAEAYSDPWRIGVAQYRAGSFAAAAKTFARVPGAPGEFNAGNAWLLLGEYDRAIAAYDRALSLLPGWNEAADNRALAMARRDQLAAAGEHADQGEPAEKADEIVFDEKAKNAQTAARDLAGGAPLSDAELQATWLRRVQTTPGEFLRAKFAYQAQHAPAAAADARTGIEP